MKIRAKRYEFAFEVLPSIYVFWSGGWESKRKFRGVSFAWMFWYLEIRFK